MKLPANPTTAQFKKIAPLLIQEILTEGEYGFPNEIDDLTWSIASGAIVGQFASGKEVYEYEISGGRKSYKPIKGVQDIGSDKPSFEAMVERFGMAESPEFAGTGPKKKKSCKKGYPCGSACISTTKKCRSAVGKQAKDYEAYLKAQSGKSGGGSVAGGGKLIGGTADMTMDAATRQKLMKKFDSGDRISSSWDRFEELEVKNLKDEDGNPITINMDRQNLIAEDVVGSIGSRVNKKAINALLGKGFSGKAYAVSISDGDFDVISAKPSNRYKLSSAQEKLFERTKGWFEEGDLVQLRNFDNLKIVADLGSKKGFGPPHSENDYQFARVGKGGKFEPIQLGDVGGEDFN